MCNLGDNSTFTPLELSLAKVFIPRGIVAALLSFSETRSRLQALSEQFFLRTKCAHFSVFMGKFETPTHISDFHTFPRYARFWEDAWSRTQLQKSRGKSATFCTFVHGHATLRRRPLVWSYLTYKHNSAAPIRMRRCYWPRLVPPSLGVGSIWLWRRHRWHT